MLFCPVLAAPHLGSASSPLPLRVLSALCVKVPPSPGSYSCTLPKTPTKTDQNRSFQISALRTLSFSVSRKSCICHSYANCRVYTNNSHFGTQRLAVTCP